MDLRDSLQFLRLQNKYPFKIQTKITKSYNIYELIIFI